MLSSPILKRRCQEILLTSPLCCLFRSLSKADAQHPLLVDLAEKSELFDKAATKYKAKAATA